MAFNRKHYSEIRKFITDRLNSVPWCYKLGKESERSPIDWAITFLPLISDCVAREDYEAAKATRDAIIEFANKFTEDKIKADVLLRIVPSFIVL
jgi:hypothetical protein